MVVTEPVGIGNNFLNQIQLVCEINFTNIKRVTNSSASTGPISNDYFISHDKKQSILIIPIMDQQNPRAITIATTGTQSTPTSTTYVPIIPGGIARWGKADEKKISEILKIRGFCGVNKKTHREKNCQNPEQYLLSILKFTSNSEDKITTGSNDKNSKFRFEEGNNDTESMSVNYTAIKRKAAESEHVAFLPPNKTIIHSGTNDEHIRKQNLRINSNAAAGNTELASNESYLTNVPSLKKTHTYDEHGNVQVMALESLKCLRVDGTVSQRHIQDDVLFAFTSVMSHLLTGSNVIIDPSIIQNVEVNSQFPVNKGKKYFPLCFAEHWSLAVFDFDDKVITIYDSLQHRRRHFEPNGFALTPNKRNVLENAWHHFTNREILQINHAPLRDTASQNNEYNCGIYVCYHINRLLMNLTDDPKRFNDHSADLMRGHVKTVLRRNFYIRDEDETSTSNEIVPFVQAPMDLQELFVSTQMLPDFTQSISEPEIYLLSKSVDHSQTTQLNRIPTVHQTTFTTVEDNERNTNTTSQKRSLILNAPTIGISREKVSIQAHTHDMDMSNEQPLQMKSESGRKRVAPANDPNGSAIGMNDNLNRREVSEECMLTAELSTICSFLIHDKTVSSSKVKFAILSPHVMSAPEGTRYNCCVWNKEINNFDVLFLPLKIGTMYGLLQYTKKISESRHKTTTVINVCTSSLTEKPRMNQTLRKKIIGIFKTHHLPETTLKIVSVNQNNDVASLCHRAMICLDEETPVFSMFLKIWNKERNNINSVRGCAHMVACPCKLYGDSIATNKRGLYHEHDLLPNGSSIGPMDKRCEFCNAHLFRKETSAVCCQSGKVMVTEEELSQQVPSFMKHHKKNMMESHELWSKSMLINNNISPASHIYRQRTITSPGERTLIIEGQYNAGLCHIQSRNNNEPAFAQIYFTTDNYLSEYLRKFPWHTKVTQSFSLTVIAELKTYNTLIQNYMCCAELLEEEKTRRQLQGITEEPRLLMNIKSRREEIPDGVLSSNVHSGRINKPAVNNQVACIWVGDIPQPQDIADGIRVRERGGETIIPHYLSNLDGLTFVLMFCDGAMGYVKDVSKYQRPEGAVRRRIKKNLPEAEHEVTHRNLNGGEDLSVDRTEEMAKCISRREFTLFMLSRRGFDEDLKYHRLLGWGKLTSQWIIFSWIRVEADRISHITKNLTEFRGVTQSSLFSHLDTHLQDKQLKLGALTTLPGSYVTSPKWSRRNYQDGMAVTMVHGNPDLFVTFTGNTKWDEITENLKGNDTWVTDPMLCARVFHQKLGQLLEDVRLGKVFGEIVGLQYSVEFQKRGMPHAHILITLKEHLTDPNKVDEIISAEIPSLPKDKNDQAYHSIEQLRAKVLRHMVHRPCKGKEKMACRQGCGNREKCQKFFPQDYSDHTYVSKTGRHIYKRREGRPVLVGSKHKIFATNADIVPYNAFILSKYDCHSNVEVVCSMISCKYIYKYIYKGPDRLVMELLGDDEESVKARKQRTVRNEKGEEVLVLNMAHEHVNARYLGHVEASYRLLGYALQGNMHTVVRLNSHLPGAKFICFRADNQPGQAKKSQLEAYFEVIDKATKSQLPAKDLLWTQVAEQYVFDDRLRVYSTRKRIAHVVAYIQFIPPKFNEQYALRLLLTKRPARSFDDLLLVNDVQYQTFTEAAIASGYIHSDDEWERCLLLVAHSAMPHEIRRIFASLLLYCNVLNGKQLWDKFKTYMRDRKPHEDHALDQFSLSHIEWILTMQGSSLEQAGMGGMLSPSLGHNSRYDPERRFVRSANTMSSGTASLNSQQEHIVTTILSTVEKPVGSPKMFFVYGKAGCGKTFLINHLLAECRSRGKRVIAVASTGIAATLLEGGRTAHSTFRIPIHLQKDSCISMDAGSDYAKRLREAELIVWDESPMQSRYAMEAVDRMMRDIAEKNRRHLPFGGTTIVFGGDWCQFLPVVRCTRGSDLEYETTQVTLKNSYLWTEIQILTLDINMRVNAAEQEHMKWLRMVGEGTCQHNNGQSINIPADMYLESEKQVIDWLYSPDVLRCPERLSKVALLSIRNDDTLDLNDSILKMLPGNEYLLLSADEPADLDQGIFGLNESVEFINTLTPSGMPPHKLKVKIGAIIMLLRNIDVSSNLCNGTRLELLDVLQDGNVSVLKCRHINGNTRDICFIQRMPLTYSDDSAYSGLAFSRIQFPIRLSFAMTVNKSQGQTFEKIGLILRTPSFAHGSTYVAVSRCVSKSGIKISMNRKPGIEGGNKIIQVRNIVYKNLI